MIPGREMEINKPRRVNSGMLIPTIIMGVLAVILFVVAYMKGGDLHLQGLKATYKLMLEIMPLLIFLS